MLGFKRCLDIDYIINPARRRPLPAPDEYRAGVESSAVSCSFQPVGFSFGLATAAEHALTLRGDLSYFISPIVVIIVVEVAGAVIIETVVIEIRNHHQRAFCAVAKVSFSFHGQYRRPDMLARLALECRAIAMDDDFITLDFEVYSIVSAPAHSGMNLLGRSCRDLYLPPESNPRRVTNRL